MGSYNNLKSLNGEMAPESEVNNLETGISLVSILDRDGIRLKRIARTNGGEWAGACPFCGGHDRFRVWPNEGRGRFWCRGCGKQGDVIDYLRESRGLSFQEACRELKIDPGVIQSQRPIREEKSNPSPSLKWQEQAESFLKETVKALWNNSKALSFLYGRGLQDKMIQASCLGWNPMDRYEDRGIWGLPAEINEKGNERKVWIPAGLVIPLCDSVSENLRAVLRLRIRRLEREPRYCIIPGSNMRPMVFHSDQESFVVVESELDGLLIHQEAGGVCGIIALGNAQAKPDQEIDRTLKQSRSILISLDFDGPGARASYEYWLKSYPQAKRWPVPVGKDPGEAFQMGLSIWAWIKAGLTVKSSSLQGEEYTGADVKPFPKEWLSRFDEEQLERLAIMTVDGGLSDREALTLLN